MSANTVAANTKNENTSPIGVFAFPTFFHARAATPGAEPRFSVTIIFDEDAQKSAQYKHMRSVALEAARNKWGAKADEMIQFAKKSGEIIDR